MEDKNNILITLLDEIKQMRTELNDLKKYVLSNLPQRVISRHTSSQSVSSFLPMFNQTEGLSALGLLPDVSVIPPLSPRKVMNAKKIENIRMNTQFEGCIHSLKSVDAHVVTPTRPINSSPKPSETVVEGICQVIHKTMKECVYDSLIDEIKPTQFYSKVKSLNNVIIFVETPNGTFGSFHSIMPKEIMQDMIDGDDQLIIFEECRNAVQIYRPKNPKEAVCSFFGDNSKNLFGVFYGYWIKVNGTYIIDSTIYENFSETVDAFKTNNGEFKRISVWVCE